MGRKNVIEYVYGCEEKIKEQLNEKHKEYLEKGCKEVFFDKEGKELPMDKLNPTPKVSIPNILKPYYKEKNIRRNREDNKLRICYFLKRLFYIV